MEENNNTTNTSINTATATTTTGASEDIRISLGTAVFIIATIATIITVAIFWIGFQLR